MRMYYYLLYRQQVVLSQTEYIPKFVLWQVCMWKPMYYLYNHHWSYRLLIYYINLIIAEFSFLFLIIDDIIRTKMLTFTTYTALIPLIVHSRNVYILVLKISKYQHEWTLGKPNKFAEIKRTIRYWLGCPHHPEKGKTI